MTTLIKYDAARHALQQAVEIDEVKDIRDKAQAMAAYAKQANDTKLIEWATEIKVRAERKAGQMLAEMDKNTGAMGSGSNQHEVRSLDVTAPKLADLGISKNQSSRWQKLAAVPEDQFEQAITAAKEVAGEVTTAAMLRIEKEIKQQNSQSHKEFEPAPKKEKQENPQESTEEECEETLEELYGDFDPIAELETANKEIERLTKIIESDDALALVVSENKKLIELNSVLESQVNGYMNSLSEFKRSTKYWKTKFEKLEKQVNGLGLVDF